MDDNAPESLLLSLPVEILLNISSHLKTPEYCNLRLSCKTIQSTVFNAFAREFFTKRQFMLTEFSLNALIEISKSRFSSSINYVIIGLERPLGYDQLYTSYLTAGPLEAFVDADPLNKIILQSISHTTFLNSAQDIEMLSEAFSNLKNLETVGLRDFNSRNRTRDYPDIEWRSYGHNTINRDFRIQHPLLARSIFSTVVRDGSNEDVTRVFLTILRALGKASSKPKHLEVILRRCALHDHAFHLPGYLQASIRPVLANLRAVFLDLGPHQPNLKIDSNGRSILCLNYFLLPFLSKLTHLEHLRLNFKSYPSDARNDVISWLSRSTDDTIVPTGNPSTGDALHFPPCVDFANLRQLEIGMILIDLESILAVVSKYRRTLRAISLHRVTLLEADDVGAEHRVNLWSKMFKQLSKLDLQLDFVSLSLLAQSKANHRHRREISFKGTRQPRIKKWAGTDIQSGLRDFISDIVVERLNVETEVESFDSEEDDSDDSLHDHDGEGNTSEDEDE